MPFKLGIVSLGNLFIFISLIFFYNDLIKLWIQYIFYCLPGNRSCINASHHNPYCAVYVLITIIWIVLFSQDFSHFIFKSAPEDVFPLLLNRVEGSGDRERGRERNIHWLVASSTCPYWAGVWTCNIGTCPWPRMELATLPCRAIFLILLLISLLHKFTINLYCDS